MSNNLWEKRLDELSVKDMIPQSQKQGLKQMITAADGESRTLAKELLRLRIEEGLVDGLNDGQVKGFAQIISHFRSPEHDAVVLKGYAGTGKTFLVRRIVEYITTAHPSKKIAITAPTNKAVHVLHRNCPFESETSVFEDYGSTDARITYCTVHKLLGLKQEVDENGLLKFVTQPKNSSLKNYHYLIVDEISMLEDRIMRNLMELKGKIRIILMGDPAQIPPVNKTDCIPFRDVTGYNFLTIELTEIMRQKGQHPIVDAGMVIRQSLVQPDPLKGIATTLNEKGHGVVVLDNVTQRKAVRKLIDKYYLDPKYQIDSDYVKTIAWRNSVVTYMNNTIREALFGTDLPRFVKGERVIANKAIFERARHPKYGNWMYKIIANTSDEFVVNHVSIISKTFSESPSNSLTLMETVNFTGQYWQLTCANQRGESQILFVLHEDEHLTFRQLLKSLRAKAVKEKDKALWVLYYNVMRWAPDISYNYAVTAHKAQGSTYKNVILIEEDIDKNHKIKERNRIKYTAFTRATDRVYTLRKT